MSLNHELRDVNVRNLLLLGGLLCLMTLGSLLGMGWLFGYFSAQPISGPPPSALELEPQIPPRPRLQLHEHIDMERKRQADEAVLTSYGWVDRKEGIVHIPIDRAMDLFAQRAQVKEAPAK
jgi:hypothetical protein